MKHVHGTSFDYINTRYDLVARNEEVFHQIFRREYDLDCDICQQNMILKWVQS